MKINEGSLSFKRLVKELSKITKYLRFKRIKHGFYRVYFKHAYIGEMYKNMPRKGYDFVDEDPRFEDKKFYEGKEDQIDLIRNIKNFVEGYSDSKDSLVTRLYMLRHDKEFNENSMRAFQTLVVK